MSVIEHRYSMRDVIDEIDALGLGEAVDSSFAAHDMPNDELECLWAVAENALQELSDYLGMH